MSSAATLRNSMPSPGPFCAAVFGTESRRQPPRSSLLRSSRGLEPELSFSFLNDFDRDLGLWFSYRLAASMRAVDKLVAWTWISSHRLSGCRVQPLFGNRLSGRSLFRMLRHAL